MRFKNCIRAQIPIIKTAADFSHSCTDNIFNHKSLEGRKDSLEKKVQPKKKNHKQTKTQTKSEKTQKGREHEYYL